MQANLIAPSFAALAVTLLATGAGAQTVISRTITTEPVETTVTQTPGGTIVTRRPADRGIVQQPTLRAPVVAPAAPAAIASGPDTIDEITTRQVVERAAATRATRATSARQMTTRQVSARGDRAPARSVQRTVTRQTIRVRTPARLALSPRDRQIVYQTIVEQQVVPRPPAVVASPVLAEPALIQRQVALPAYRPPIVAADEEAIVRPAGPVYAVGSVLPRNVPLYAVPQNVALSVPATQTYSYAYLGGRAYLVDPASGIIVADVTE